MSDTIFFPTQREQAAKLLSSLSLVQYVVSSHRTQGTNVCFQINKLMIIIWKRVMKLLPETYGDVQ